ncbi:MAG: VWA domain-containing protein, partial [Thermoanaerobaculia bacterium]
ALFLIPAVPALAQGGEAVFTEEIDVEVVSVEVVVTDKQGNSVTGLGREDFEVFDNGRPVKLTNFYAVDGTGSTPTSVDASITAGEATVGDGAAELPPTGTTRGLNLVIFIDNPSILPQNRRLLFENLRGDLKQNLGPGSQVMLVTLGRRIEVAQQLTSDFDQILTTLGELEKDLGPGVQLDAERRMLLSRLNRASTRDSSCRSRRRSSTSSTGGGGGGGGLTDPLFDEAVRTARELALNVRTLAEQRYQNGRNTIAALASFADTLGGLPGRKAMLYVSDGVPMRPADSMLEAWISKYDSWFQQNETAISSCSRYPDAPSDFRQVFTALGSSQFDLHNDFGRLTARASDNRVAFYPVSSGDRGSSYVSAANSGSSSGGQVLRAAMVAEGASRNASLLQMADDTGGLAFTGTSNVGEVLRRLSGDFSAFYSLGYLAPDSKRDSKFHKIEVKVRRDGVVARHVSGYIDKTWRDRLGDMTVAAALYGLESNPLGITLTPEEPKKKGKRFKVRVLVQIPFRDLVMVSDGENYNAKLALLAVVRDSKGGFSPPRRFDLPIQIPNAAILQARQQSAAFPLDLEVGKNAEVVAVGVRDHYAQTASCVRVDLDLGSGKG